MESVKCQWLVKRTVQHEEKQHPEDGCAGYCAAPPEVSLLGVCFQAQAIKLPLQLN